jgi:hypothetical protein
MSDPIDRRDDAYMDEDYLADGGCPGYPEHDYRVMGEADGDVAYVCRRCDAELIEASEDRGSA